jgi:glycosyltransferase involved in cell wall biosynthesis
VFAKMKLFFLTRLYSPHIGGVERHVMEVGRRLIVKGESITVLTERHDEKLKGSEIINGVKVIRFSYPKIKFFGLVSIWFWLFKNRKLIEESDVVHCHDVFIWYLPFRFLYPQKPVFTTFHGLEWDRLFSRVSIFQKHLAAKLSNGTIGVGKFLEKYLKIKFDLITYGAVSMYQYIETESRNRIVFVGRLQKDTGIIQFLKWFNENPGYKVDFCGDGPLRKECEKYGNVHGFTDPTPFYKKARYCVPGGYLAALEALNAGCLLKLFWSDKVKEDYWKMSPFVKKDVKEWARKQTWEKLTNEYLDLYNNAK